MLTEFRDFIAGWRVVSFPLPSRAAVFDLMYREGIAFSKEAVCDGSVRIRVREKYIKRLLSELDSRQIDCEISKLNGLFAVIKFLGFRPALAAGFLLFFGWMLYSSRIIWSIRVYGNEKTDVREIISLLDELGCGIGDYYPSIDFNEVHAKYAAAQHDIAWLSVYMNGTVAEVQVRELWEDKRVRHDKNVYANVVAKCDGVVESVNVFEGQACVKAGDTVRAGQLLISGVVENKDGSIRLEYAAGEVLCTVAVPLRSEINTEREEKVYTGRINTKKSIKIFKKTINLFIKGGIVYDTYDKINTMEQLCPFGLCTVPIWINKTVYREYIPEMKSISSEDAADEAMALLNEKIKKETKGAELISRTVDINSSEERYTIDCLLYLRRNVAETSEFSMNSGSADNTSMEK